MKKLLSLCVLALLVFCQPGIAQKKKTPVKKKTYKPVAAKKPAPPPVQYDALATYIRVWGLIKYQHPAVAGGALDADSLFLSNLYTVERVANKNQFNQAMTKMLVSLGDLPSDGGNLAAAENADWATNNPLLDDNLRWQLQQVARHGIPEGDASSEKIADHLESVLFYQDIQYPNMPYQMLSFARYWNSVHFSNTRDSQQWDTVLTHYLPGFYKARTEADVEQLMRNVMAASGQSQSANFKIKSAVSQPIKRKRVTAESGLTPAFIEEYRNKRRFLQPPLVVINERDIKSLPKKKNDWQFAV